MNWVILFLRCVAATKASSLKGIPVPGANKLDQVLSRFLNRTDYTGAIFEYLRGEDNARRSDHLDMRVLDRDNVRNLINTILSNHGQNYRRHIKHEAYYNEPESNAVKETALDMMKQSIYATKFRMNETRRFRKKYQDDPSFHIAVYYGALMQISNKMETLFTIIKKLKRHTHFLWFLVIYEKILSANVDAHDMVDRIFDLHDKYQKQINGETIVLAPTIPITPGPTQATRRRRTRTRPPEVARPTGLEGGPGGDWTPPPEETHHTMPDDSETRIVTKETFYTRRPDYDTETSTRENDNGETTIEGENSNGTVADKPTDNDLTTSQPAEAT